MRYWLLSLMAAMAMLRPSQCNTILTFGGASAANETDRDYHSSMLCMDLRPQKSVDMKEMMGMWYGVEIIVHNKDIRGIFRYHSCVQVHLSDITDQVAPLHVHDPFVHMNIHSGYFRSTNPGDSEFPNDRQDNYPPQQQLQQTVQRTAQHYYSNRKPSDFDLNNGQRAGYDSDSSHDESPDEFAMLGHPKYLQLIWSEKENNLEYILNYTNLNPGIWHNVQPQRGSLAIPNQYTQFTGTVQVIKAVSDHVVLTFCNNNVKSSIYTIVLSRKRWGLPEDTVRSVRSMLANRGLSTDTIRQVCMSGAIPGSTIHFMLFVSLVLVSTLKAFF